METLKKLQAGILICVANIRNMRKRLDYTASMDCEME